MTRVQTWQRSATQSILSFPKKRWPLTTTVGTPGHCSRSNSASALRTSRAGPGSAYSVVRRRGSSAARSAAHSIVAGSLTSSPSPQASNMAWSRRSRLLGSVA